jgi:hypothetical protein
MVEEITVSISVLLLFATEVNSSNGRWMAGEAAQNICVPTNFPVPLTQNSRCPQMFPSTPRSPPTWRSRYSWTSLKPLVTWDHPSSSITQSLEVMATYPDSFVMVDSHLNEFSSLPFAEHQKAAQESIFLLIADQGIPSWPTSRHISRCSRSLIGM